MRLSLYKFERQVEWDIDMPNLLAVTIPEVSCPALLCIWQQVEVQQFWELYHCIVYCYILARLGVALDGFPVLTAAIPSISWQGPFKMQGVLLVTIVTAVFGHVWHDQYCWLHLHQASRGRRWSCCCRRMAALAALSSSLQPFGPWWRPFSCALSRCLNSR